MVSFDEGDRTTPISIEIREAIVKVGDLVRVNENCVTPFIGIVAAVNSRGGAFVRGVDRSRSVWAYDWFTEIISESR